MNIQKEFSDILRMGKVMNPDALGEAFLMLFEKLETEQPELGKMIRSKKDALKYLWERL